MSRYFDREKYWIVPDTQLVAGVIPFWHTALTVPNRMQGFLEQIQLTWTVEDQDLIRWRDIRIMGPGAGYARWQLADTKLCQDGVGQEMGPAVGPLIYAIACEVLPGDTIQLQVTELAGTPTTSCVAFIRKPEEKTIEALTPYPGLVGQPGYQGPVALARVRTTFGQVSPVRAMEGHRPLRTLAPTTIDRGRYRHVLHYPSP